MRKQYAKILKAHFRKSLLQTRGLRGLTQEEMAPKLLMSVRSYCALEGGGSCCGALTLALYLVFISDDSIAFLAELRHAFEKQDLEAA